MVSVGGRHSDTFPKKGPFPHLGEGALAARSKNSFGIEMS
jgi:hypothetical protein